MIKNKEQYLKSLDKSVDLIGKEVTQELKDIINNYYQLIEYKTFDELDYAIVPIVFYKGKMLKTYHPYELHLKGGVILKGIFKQVFCDGGDFVNFELYDEDDINNDMYLFNIGACDLDELNDKIISIEDIKKNLPTIK